MESFSVESGRDVQVGAEDVLHLFVVEGETAVCASVCFETELLQEGETLVQVVGLGEGVVAGLLAVSVVEMRGSGSEGVWLDT